MGQMKVAKWLREIVEKYRIKRHKQILDSELFDSCMILKNLSIVQQENPLSADFVFEKLLENGKRLKPYYGELILYYRQGDEEKAFGVFSKKIGTRYGKIFGGILSKLDKINPAEIINQVEAFQEVLEDEKITRELKKADRNSLISTMFAAITIFVILLNFTVVVVFMDTMAMLENLI